MLSSLGKGEIYFEANQEEYYLLFMITNYKNHKEALAT